MNANNWQKSWVSPTGPALHTDETLFKDMTDMLIYNALIEPAKTVTEACIANNIKCVDLEPLNSLGVSTTIIGEVGADRDLLETDGSIQSKEPINERVAMA